MKDERTEIKRKRSLHKLFDAETDDFVALAAMAGFDVLTDFAGSDLQGVDVSGARFDKADFGGTVFRGAKLNGTSFAGANLRGADFRGALLQEADFRGTLLNGANLEEAQVQGAKFAFDNALNADQCEALQMGGALFENARAPYELIAVSPFRQKLRRTKPEAISELAILLETPVTPQGAEHLWNVDAFADWAFSEAGCGLAVVESALFFVESHRVCPPVAEPFASLSGIGSQSASCNSGRLEAFGRAMLGWKKLVDRAAGEPCLSARERWKLKAHFFSIADKEAWHEIGGALLDRVGAALLFAGALAGPLLLANTYTKFPNGTWVLPTAVYTLVSVLLVWLVSAMLLRAGKPIQSPADLLASKAGPKPPWRWLALPLALLVAFAAVAALVPVPNPFSETAPNVFLLALRTFSLVGTFGLGAAFGLYLDARLLFDLAFEVWKGRRPIDRVVKRLVILRTKVCAKQDAGDRAWTKKFRREVFYDLNALRVALEAAAKEIPGNGGEGIDFAVYLLRVYQCAIDTLESLSDGERAAVIEGLQGLLGDLLAQFLRNELRGFARTAGDAALAADSVQKAKEAKVWLRRPPLDTATAIGFILLLGLVGFEQPRDWIFSALKSFVDRAFPPGSPLHADQILWLAKAFLFIVVSTFGAVTLAGNEGSKLRTSIGHAVSRVSKSLARQPVTQSF